MWQPKKNWKKIKNRWVSCKYHLFCKFIISSRWTTASCSCATCSGSKAFQNYVSTQKWTGRKDGNSLVVEHHHDTHCHCIVYSGFKEKRNWAKTQHPYWAKYSQLFLIFCIFLCCLSLGAQSSGSGQIKGNTNICRDSTTTCSLLSFPVEALKHGQEMSVAIFRQQGFPPTWKDNYLSGVLGTHWPKNLFWLIKCKDETTHLLSAAKPH